MTPARRFWFAVSGLLLAVVLVLIAVGIASCGMEDSSRFNDAFCVATARDSESVDALDWLKDPFGGPKRLGKLGTDEGLGLATMIQARGAKTIVAAKVHTIKGPEPYQYAEGLIVELPDDLARRRQVFELYARVVRGEGFEPQADTGQKYLYFVWRH